MSGEFTTAKISFKIESNAIAGCYSTPDMGSEPEKIDITSFDEDTYKKYKEGLIDVQNFNFDFFDKTENYKAARAAEGKQNTYDLSYPDGSGYTITGTHRTYKLAAQVGDVVKFRISVTPSGKVEPRDGSTTTTTAS